MSMRTFRLASLSTHRDEYHNLIAPLLVAAQTLGHEAYGLRAEKADRILEFARAKRLDFCLLTGRTVAYLVKHDTHLLQTLCDARMPLVVLWYDNPLRYLDTLSAIYTENVLVLTSIDTYCVRELQRLGFERVVYLPIWSLTANFQPVPPTKQMQCELSFSGGYMSREYFETVYMPKYLPSQYERLYAGEDSPGRQARQGLVERFVTLRRQTRQHVNVYDFLRAATTMDPFTASFHGWSSLLMHYQKMIEREQLFESVGQVPGAVLHCYGGADVVLQKSETMRSEWPQVKFFPALDRHTELQLLYCSSEINLGLSQFPRAVHNRYFECAACGGFMIGEYKEDLDGLFEVGREMICFKELEELPELIQYYQQHEAERRRIGARARARHLKQHTPRHRLQHLLPRIAEELVRFRDQAGAPAWA